VLLNPAVQRGLFRPMRRPAARRQRAFDAFLQCGILARCFLWVRCGDCGHNKLIAVQLQATRLLYLAPTSRQSAPHRSPKNAHTHGEQVSVFLTDFAGGRNRKGSACGLARAEAPARYGTCI
jgi:hypothetical protein